MTALKRFLLLALVLAPAPAVPAAAQHSVRLPDATEVTLTAENSVPEIPFDVVNNHVILPVSVKGSAPLKVVLDTGMPAPGLALFSKPSTSALGLDIDPSIQARVAGAGGDGDRASAQIALQESFAMPGVAFDKSPVIVMPGIHGFGGYHDGIIGLSLFERFVVELDYDDGRMRLHDPESWTPPHDAHVLPLTLRGNLPYTELRVTPEAGEPFDALCVIDLGASHAISLNTDESDKIKVPERSLTAMLGRGLSGPVEGEVGRIAALELGGARLEDVVASFPISEHQNPRGVDSMAGNLGAEALRRFNTTFDYANLRMILEPNRAFEEPFEFDRSGIRLGYGSELEVERIIAGSPAADASIRIGDVITHVDGQPVSGEDYGEVREALMGIGQVRLSIRRDAQTFDRTLALRTLI